MVPQRGVLLGRWIGVIISSNRWHQSHIMALLASHDPLLESAVAGGGLVLTNGSS